MLKFLNFLRRVLTAYFIMKKMEKEAEALLALGNSLKDGKVSEDEVKDISTKIKEIPAVKKAKERIEKKAKDQMDKAKTGVGNFLKRLVKKVIGV